MALQLLDGTDATVDLGVTFPSGTAASSFRCIVNQMEYRRNRQFQTAKTLCSTKWESEKPSVNQDFITVQKFGSRGATISDLSPLMTMTASASVVFTAYTGCTYSGSFWLSDDFIGVNAGSFAMPGSCSFRSDGAVSTAWVIT